MGLEMVSGKVYGLIMRGSVCAVGSAFCMFVWWVGAISRVHIYLEKVAMISQVLRLIFASSMLDTWSVRRIGREDSKPKPSNTHSNQSNHGFTMLVVFVGARKQHR